MDEVDALDIVYQRFAVCEERPTVKESWVCPNSGDFSSMVCSITTGSNNSKWAGYVNSMASILTGIFSPSAVMWPWPHKYRLAHTPGEDTCINQVSLACRN